LGNNWPIILTKLEDCVLKAIIDILAGKATQGAVDALYYQIQSLEKDLATDKQALKWFELFSSPSSAPLNNAIRGPSLAGLFLAFHLSVFSYLTTFHITDGLFSHLVQTLQLPLSHLLPCCTWPVLRLPL
jgi:hypothetical protein